MSDTLARVRRSLVDMAYARCSRSVRSVGESADVSSEGLRRAVVRGGEWCAWRLGGCPTGNRLRPDSAAAAQSAEAGHPVTVAGPLATIMAGLRCAEPSPLAWPSIRDGVTAFVSIPDESVLDTIECMRHPKGSDPRIEAGPSGACGVAALMTLMRAPELADARSILGLGPSTHAFAVVTEGP